MQLIKGRILILVDTIYINNGGGKVLLNYLIKSLEESELDVFYLLDARIDENEFPAIKHKSVFLKASLYNRYLFYKKNKNKFSKVFCFGNLPPVIKLSVPVYTYFHQKLFLKTPAELPFKQKIVIKFKKIIFKALLKNSNYWFVQTNLVKEELLNSYPLLKKETVLILPFYPENNYNLKWKREKNTFVYVSSGASHKNHIRLIEAFVKFYDKHKSGKLFLTIGVEFPILLNLINGLNLKGYPIINKGFLEEKELAKLYHESEFLIFPSLSESFGLGLLEAMENGCKIIGANLEYTFAVCNPSLIFDPLSIESIAEAFLQASKLEVKSSEQLIFNKIDDLIRHLKT